MSFACLYFGPADECRECGGFDPTGTGFCSHDCRADQARRTAAIEADIQRRRDQDDAFARECERLRAEGHTDREIDALLAHMP